jgi:cephalosporin hydroxylase
MNKYPLNPVEEFYQERDKRIESYKNNKPLQTLADDFVKELAYARYTSNFTWLGRPVIQLPQDLFVLQEIIWAIKPDFIIETGIAHGGSLIFYASMLELIGGKGKVIGIDIDIRQHNRVEIENHPLFHRIVMIEGSSVDENVVEQVKGITNGAKSILVCLDSNHTHDHVLKELQFYTPLVSVGSYCVVFDTGIEDLSKDMIQDRPWGPGNNPKTAVWKFLQTNDRFVIDKDIDTKILISSAPDGYLRCVK